VSKFALRGALRAHRESGKEKDKEWADLALAYLRVRARMEEQGEIREDTATFDELEDATSGLRTYSRHTESE
jgi:hypothetical protein